MFSRSQKFAVLFDMDGTLIDSEPYWMKSERDLAAAHNGAWTEQDGLEIVGMSLDKSSKLIKERANIPLEPEEIVQQLTASVQRELSREIPWRPGAKELLRDLRKHGVKTALVTMSMRKMASQVVDAIDFDAFDVIVAGDDVMNGKPHPEAYLKAAEQLGFEPAKCIAFEDSNSGLASAEAAGTFAIGIPHIVPIPAKPGRTLWTTLEGVTYKQLKKMVK
ncbi:MAG: HAD family phosphatase [Micrococcales bacterium]|nr:HAD family phosphatase [Micrococcales bacterium]NBR60384.1 HAD family phosphatase [Actinomycetota bacterium]NBR54444.1 HAD family phosphatase [Micrococcales bacterium]NBT46278.1 HAD family phosphatase [Actinomycetota bacterium]NBY44334.1 HAD family phosphatase [Micrococcales bacterium]